MKNLLFCGQIYSNSIYLSYFNSDTMKYIERQMGKTLLSSLNVFPSITLTGPRQSGKTTLCRHLFPDMPYLNMENLQTSTLFNQNPVGFLNRFSNRVIIDAVQSGNTSCILGCLMHQFCQLFIC